MKKTRLIFIIIFTLIIVLIYGNKVLADESAPIDKLMEQDLFGEEAQDKTYKDDINEGLNNLKENGGKLDSPSDAVSKTYSIACVYYNTNCDFVVVRFDFNAIGNVSNSSTKYLESGTESSSNSSSIKGASLNKWVKENKKCPPVSLLNSEFKYKDLSLKYKKSIKKKGTSESSNLAKLNDAIEKEIESNKKACVKGIDIFKPIKRGINFDIKNGCSLASTDTGKFLARIIKYFVIVGVVLTIVLGAFDFVHSVASLEEEGFKKSRSKFVMRIIALVILLLLPVILNLVFNNIQVSNDPQCELSE